MEVVKCRCCLVEGMHKDLNSSHDWLDKKEVYADMLSECFNIVLSQQQYESNSICETCIKTLRSSLSFKRQVLHCEQEMLERLKDAKYNEKKTIEIKLEPKPDSGDESDDYFLSDTVTREVTMRKVKVETNVTPSKKTEQKRNRSKTAVKKTVMKQEENWKSGDVKTLVTRLAASTIAHDAPVKANKQKKTIKTTKTVAISKNTVCKEPKIKLMWSTPNREKIKHKENLQTILQFSNATPFKDKSLLGFICAYCETAYPDPAELRTHTEIEHKKERLGFKNTFDMTEYIVKLDVTDLTCTLCDKKLENLGLFKDHLVKTHSKILYSDIKDHMLQFKLKKGDVYDCAMCPSTYETFKMLKQHMNIHYCNYTCQKCDSSFATKRSLTAHRITHQEGSFKCDHCEKIFPSRYKKHYHEKMKHLGASNIRNCPYCNEPFRSYYRRNQHLIQVHNSEAKYKCNVCNKSYILKSLLMCHIKKNHLMERNCQCTECGFRFFSKKALKAHMVKHTGERNFACEVCHKSYARKYTLREHMRIHNNDRRFKCDVCGMLFVQKCSLKSHLLSHHGISLAASEIKTTEP